VEIAFMTSTRGKDVALIVGLLIPVAMIVFIAAAIYLPRAFTRVDPPQWDFLYMVGYPPGTERVFVRDGRLVREDVDAPPHAPTNPRYELQFYVHRVPQNTSERVTFEQACLLQLDNTSKSPDGFQIVHGRRSQFLFPFTSSTDYRERYLKKDGYALELDLATGSGAEGGYFSHAFTFLGWIGKGATWTK
jgi:hypothetical protein